MKIRLRKQFMNFLTNNSIFLLDILQLYTKFYQYLEETLKTH